MPPPPPKKKKKKLIIMINFALNIFAQLLPH